MYVPELYRPSSLSAQHDLISANPFGLLITRVDGELSGVHIPFVLDRQIGEFGRLRGHLSRANPIAAALDDDAEVMVSFTGPQSYICPDDYASQPHFPTWNYSAVHAHGRPRILDAKSSVRQLVDLIADQEGRRPAKQAWTLDRVSDDLFDHYRAMIVAFELPVLRLAGIFKFGQNKEPADVAAQIGAFRSRQTDSADRMADQLAMHNQVEAQS